MDDLLNPEMFPKELLHPPQEVQVQVDACSDVSVCSLISNRHQSRRAKRNNRKKSRSWSISSKGSDSGLDTGAMSESKGSAHDSSDSDDSRRSRSRRRRRRRKHRSRSDSDSDSDSSSERRARRRRRRRRRKQRKHRRSRSRAHRDTNTRGSRSDSTSSTGSTSRSREREQARRRQRSVDSYGSPLRSRSPDRRRRRSRRGRSSERPSPRRTFTGGFGQGFLPGGGFGHPGSAPEKRVYVGGGGLPVMGELAVADLFNHALLAAMHLDDDKERRPFRGDPVVSVYLNPSKPFGFVELATAALATATLQLDGILRLDGHGALRIRRPTDYRPVAGGGEPCVALDLSVFGIKKNNAPAPTAVGVSDQVPDGPFKVFIGGLPYHMSEADIQTMLTAAGGGPLRALRVVKDQTPQPVTIGVVPLAEGEEKNRGFGFCEFCDPECAQRACQALNGLVLPGAGTRVLSLRMGAVGGNKGTYPHPQLSLNLPLPPTMLNMPPNPLLLLHRLGQANAGPGLKQVESQSAPTPSLLSAMGHESSSSASAMKVSRPTTPAAFS